jgi:hypothetical protein
MLVSIDLPVLECRELKADQGLVGRLGDVDLNISDVEISLLVLNVGPVELPLNQVEK